MRNLSLVLMVGLALGCGKIDKTETTSTPIPGYGSSNQSSVPQSMLVDSAANLPACAAANEGQLVYVQQQQVFAACESGKWTQVNVAGSGSGAGIDTAIYCSMTAAKADLVAAGLENAPDSGINFNYTVTRFTNKTLYVQARISSGSYSYSSGIFWNSNQQGYSKAMSDNIAFDVHGAQDFGFWQMMIDPTVTGDQNNPYAIVYADPTLDSGKALVFDSKQDCIVNVYQ